MRFERAVERACHDSAAISGLGVGLVGVGERKVMFWWKVMSDSAALTSASGLVWRVGCV